MNPGHVSAFDLFSIGVGPSSSHTVGPMRAARRFAVSLEHDGALDRVERVTCHLFGSLGATGGGHGTLPAVVAGLAGHDPETVAPEAMARGWAAVEAGDGITLKGGRGAEMAVGDFELQPGRTAGRHVNSLRLEALGAGGALLRAETFYSTGGGFVESEHDPVGGGLDGVEVPFGYGSAAELLELCGRHGLSIAELARANECARRPAEWVEARLDRIWEAMSRCVAEGLATDGLLPGGLGVVRRARSIAEHLGHAAGDASREWLQAYAMAVGEQNASGRRVVTAPTNGAAGIIPAVLTYAVRFLKPTVEKAHAEFLLVASAIGGLYKRNASISGAEAGCQGEVGSAASMAAGGLAHILGGTPGQVENAAEVAMEHNLGLTCDPVGGLVQLPCIERGAIAAGSAVSAAQLALCGDGTHRISLDTVIETMRQTGIDLSTKYKETSLGGLAVNVVEC